MDKVAIISRSMLRFSIRLPKIKLIGIKENKRLIIKDLFKNF